MPPSGGLIAHIHRLPLSPRALRPVSLSITGRIGYVGVSTMSVMENMMAILELEVRGLAPPLSSGSITTSISLAT